ncbi:TPM domain-containing protein [Arcobacter sp. LA11]|uniref:TPM domain-containing protein n=1 Tax=Arcobacter sp. LA11 TaxID=1898176 RepID=UPI00093286B9|nr:TPM domain-containing protein [Arcobacter sp. LA11]
MHLNDNEKQQISKEIENLEKESSAELVAVITKQSSSYKFETIAFALLLSTIISLVTLLFETSAIKLFQIQVISFLSFYLIFEKFNKILLALLPKSYKYTKASEYANKQFVNLGLQTTKTKQAIMFFVSYDEKFVEIITDSKIKEKIEDNYWQVIVDEFIKDVKNNDLSSGYLKAIKSCNSILIKNFPIKENDENELPNDVVEL